MKSALKYYAKLDALLDAHIFHGAWTRYFTALDNGKTAEEAAAALSVDTDKYGGLNFGSTQSIKILLDVLTVQGLITVDGNCYRNTDETQQFYPGRVPRI